MSAPTRQNQFAAASGFNSERQWHFADRVIVYYIDQLVRNDPSHLLNLLQDLPRADKTESADERILRQQLIATPIPAFVDQITAHCVREKCGIPADTMLKPVLRALRTIHDFAICDNDPLEEGMEAVLRLLKGGRYLMFEYQSQPPQSGWKRPAFS